VPFLAVWPGTIPAGLTDDTTLFGAVDVFPTVCKLAGVELPGDARTDGEDRSPALLGKPQAGRARPLFWEYGRNNTSFDYPSLRNGARAGDRSPSLAVRDDRWKLLVNADGTGAQLYDVTADPSETKDLAANHPEQVTRLTRLVLDWRMSLP
jgi:arylsulfatase A-like enzyme